MGMLITSFRREDIEFSDMGTCIYIKENSEKFYYIKMIHHNREKKTRDIYLLAIAEPQVQKWDNSLNLEKLPFFVDNTLLDMKSDLVNMIEDDIFRDQSQVM
jgi:hypothetical protein